MRLFYCISAWYGSAFVRRLADWKHTDLSLFSNSLDTIQYSVVNVRWNLISSDWSCFRIRQVSGGGCRYLHIYYTIFDKRYNYFFMDILQTGGWFLRSDSHRRMCPENYVSFRLFIWQDNTGGHAADTCSATVHGKPYPIRETPAENGCLSPVSGKYTSIRSWSVAQNER